MRHWLKYFIAVAFLAGCGSVSPSSDPSRIVVLTQTLQRLDLRISHEEAEHLSRDIYTKTVALFKEFGMVSPPQYHNFLVTVGLKKKGLCYHWADALYMHLKMQGYRDFEFHLVGANIGKYWTEHNALVVVAKGCKNDACILKTGVVIDGWRNAGELYFSQVPKDKSYHWTHRHTRCYDGV